MKVRAILDNELLNGIEVKKNTITEVDDLLGDYLMKAYSDRREKVEENEEVEEVKETKEDEEDEEEIKIKPTRKKK